MEVVFSTLPKFENSNRRFSDQLKLSVPVADLRKRERFTEIQRLLGWVERLGLRWFPWGCGVLGAHVRKGTTSARRLL
jgi:hypothetical protein